MLCLPIQELIIIIIITTNPIKKKKRRGKNGRSNNANHFNKRKRFFLFMLLFSTDIVTECHLYSKAEIRFMAHLQIDRKIEGSRIV